MVDETIYARLASSKFRSRFHLSKKDKEYFYGKGRDKIREHACDFVRKRLAPTYPTNDGKQTPMKGCSPSGRRAFCTDRSGAKIIRFLLRSMLQRHVAEGALQNGMVFRKAESLQRLSRIML